MRRIGKKQISLGLALFAALGTAAPVKAQEFHLLQGGQLNKVQFTDEYTGFTVEDGGRIRYTADGGATWTFAHIDGDIRVDLYALYFLNNNPDTAWAVGDGGVVLKSVPTTSGTEWTEATQTSNRITDELDNSFYSCTGIPHHPARLQAIFMTDTSTGWAIGYDGAVATTTNNWFTWTRPSMPGGFSCGGDPDDLYDIHFFYESTAPHYQKGIICGDRRYYTTDDGGTTWDSPAMNDTCPQSGTYVELWRMSFDNPEDSTSLGWMVGGSNQQNSEGFIFRLAGIAATLTTPWTITATQETCFNVLDINDEIAAGAANGEGCDFATVYDVAKLGASAPRAIAAAYGGQMFVHEDESSSITGNFSPPCTYQGSCGSSCTPPNGQLWVEQDTASFDENDCGQRPQLNGVCRISDTQACAVGKFGRILTFDSQNSSAPLQDRGTLYFSRLADGVFHDANDGLAIGQNYQIYLTDNAGVTWRNVSSWGCGDGTAYGNGIDLSPSGTYGVAVGTGGFVAYSSNSGDDWTQLVPHATPQQIPSPLADLTAVAFVPGSGSVTAYAVGNSGTVIKSTDSGAHWLAVAAAGSPDGLNGLSFVDATHGYVVGDNGGVYATGNGGTSWRAVSVAGSPTTNFNDVAAWGSWGTNGAAAILVGDNGAIYEKSASATSFSAVSTGLGATAAVRLNDVEVLNSGADIRIAGDFGTMLFRDSSNAWTAPNSQTTFPLFKAAFQSTTSGKAIGSCFIVLDYH